MSNRRKKAASAPQNEEEQQPEIQGTDTNARDSGVADSAEGETEPAAPPDSGEPEYKLPAWQQLTTYPAGVRLTHDRVKGCYRIHFDPKMEKEEFKEFFREKLKPLLEETHTLKSKSLGDRQVRFYFDPANLDWEMRFRYLDRDRDGNEILSEDGKKQYVSYHNQVQVIAQRVTDKAAGLLQEKLGLAEPSTPIPD